MAYVKNWLHLVWNTKLHKPFLTKEVKELLLPHIIENALGKGIYIDTINAHREHVHCLISLNADQTLSKVLQLIKGESSIWFKQAKHLPRPL